MKIKWIAFVTAIVILTASVCSACNLSDALGTIMGGNYWMQFKNNSIVLTVGERVDFTRDDFVFEDGEPSDDWDFSLSSDEYTVVDAAGKSVYAMSTGVATVTAKDDDGKRAKLTVTVIERLESISLEFPFGSALPIGSDKSIDVVCVDASGKTSLNGVNVEWTVNDSELAFNGDVLTLYNAGKEENFLIEASVTKNIGGELVVFKASANACYYSAPPTAPEILASKTEVDNGEEVTFTLTGCDTADWLVDGERVSSGSEFSFSAEEDGYYEVSAVAYGLTSAVTAIKVGSAPKIKNFSLNIDDYFPEIRLEWDDLGDGFNYEVEVTQGNKTDKFTTQNDYAAIGVDPKRDFTASVRSLGDGKMLATAVGENVIHYDGDDKIVEYLGKKWFGGNYYIDGEEDFIEFFDYMMYFRPSPQSTEKVSHSEKVYVSSECNVGDLMDVAFAGSGVTGSYAFGSERIGNEVTLKIEYNTTSVPTKTSAYNEKYHDLPLDYLSYHVSETGGFTDLFPVADKGEVEVTTGEQLFRVAELGFTPVPKEGTRAAELYAVAASVIESVVADGMSDFEKAHAVYDYVLAKNSYDGSVLDYSLDDAVSHSAFYIDAILKEGDAFGVCDSMAKTYSLLCNMAGLECIRVTGYAGTATEKGGHAWNKVKVDGKWYIVDCTWGDGSISLKLDGAGVFSRSISGESASHSYFLITDADVSTSHVEDIGDYPKTALIPYYSHDKLYYGEVDGYIQSNGADLYSELNKIATYLTGNTQNEMRVKLYGIDRKTKFFGAELMVCDRSLTLAAEYLSSSQTAFFRTLSNAGLRYSVLRDENLIYIVVSKSVALKNQTLGGASSPIAPPWLGGWL